MSDLIKLLRQSNDEIDHAAADEIERLTATNDKWIQKDAVKTADALKAHDEISLLQARVESLEGDIKTHFEHGWNRGFHAGSAQSNTLPSDWRGYRAILDREAATEQGESDG